MKNKVEVSIVVALYNEEKVILDCFNQINSECKTLNKKYEIIFVNDGSTDNSLEILKQIAQQNNFVKIVNLSRNFGQRPAIMAGYKFATGNVIINMDADMQDPASLITKFIDKWQEGFDVVLAKRKNRKGETFFKRFSSKLYYRTFQRLTKSKTPLDCGITRLISKKVLNHILSMPEHNIYLAGMTEFVGFKQTYIEYDRVGRKQGNTKYTKKDLVKLAVNNIMPYSNAPIYFILKLSIFLILSGILMLASLATLSICKVSFISALWVIASMLTLTGVAVLSIGIIGFYVILSYTETLNRPKYIISETYNIGDEND